MRCETARKRLPDARAERHVSGCAECRAWLDRVERGRGLAQQALGPAPADLSGRVMAAVRREAPGAPPTDARPSGLRTARPRRPSLPRRAVGVAAALAIVATVAAVWLVRSGGTLALAQAAEATAAADSARFTFEGEFSVSFGFPPETQQRVREFEARLGERIADATEGLRLPPDVPADLKELIEERLKRAGEEIRREYHRLPSLALGGMRLSMAGSGVFAGPDRVRIEGEIEALEPAGDPVSFELIRADDEVVVRVGDAGWRVLRRGLPAGVLRPIGLGLDRLTEWLEEGAPGAERLGERILDGVSTELYRLEAEGPPGIRNRVDVWVGVEDGLVHRILTAHETRRGPAALSGSMDIRLFDHGAPLDVELPEDRTPADDAGLPVEIAVRLDEVDLWFGVELPGPSDHA